ncbi:transposase [Streptomyces sp. NBC_01102]|uniref:transposase n=1 Tax=unclassified Streptomyces TaxID=2593676 RepID=UPI00386C45BD|nr:transposase [Streptomyces sp. NBC_01102]
MGDELAEVTVPRIWAGVDIGEEHHHCVVINADGERLLSRRVLNDETVLLELIGDVLTLDTDVLWAVDLNHGGALIEARFREHPHAEVIVSLPGMGKLLGAVFLAATGGDMDAFGSADRLAGFAGLAPAPRASGRVSGNLRRPRRFRRALLNAMYLSALSSLKSCPATKSYYARERAEGKGHEQALLALARRRINVLWAMIHDGVCYQDAPAVTAAA